jgi:hypothetical protein
VGNKVPSPNTGALGAQLNRWELPIFRTVLATMLCLSTPAFCHASATGHPHWSKVDFTEETNQGTVRVQMEASVVDGRRVLSKLNIWVNGHSLPIPSHVDLRVNDPQLHNVEAVYTASITCIDDDCPSALDYPVWLMINFGERFRRDADEQGVPGCEDSTIFIDVFTRRIGTIKEVNCGETSEITKILYEPQEAPNKSTERARGR